jgi:PKD repeat protein
MPKSSTVLFLFSAAKDLLKVKRRFMLSGASAAATTGLFLIFALFTAPLFSIIAFTPSGGQRGFTQWVVDGHGGDNNPYYLMQQAYATEAQPEVPEEEGGEEQQPTPLIASMNIDSTNGDTAPATFLFETEPEGGTEPYTFSWNFGDGSPQSNEQNTDHTFANPGTYVVSLTVTDSTGQTVSDREEVIVRPATTTEEPQPPTNTTTPTEPGPTQNQTQFEQNQTETTGAVEAIQCPPGSIARGPIDLMSGSASAAATDPLNQFSTDGGTTWNAAYIVEKHPLYDLISGTQYISFEPTSLQSFPTSSDTWYRVTFTLPSGFTSASLNGQIHADDWATVYLNPTTPLPSPNNQIGAQSKAPTPPTANFQNAPETFGTTANFVRGTNTLYFHVHNVDGFTALDYLATVQYCALGLSTDPGDGPPTGGNAICPATNVKHWDKIIFEINNNTVAASLQFLTDAPLDIKVLDDPKTVADIEKKVLEFLGLPDSRDNRSAISIIDVEYAIICAS